jgi:hypothetical protein
MKVIRSFGVVSMGKYLGILYAMLGLVVGVIYGGIMMIVGAIGASAGGEGSGALGALGIGGGIAAIIFAPIIYGFLGFIIGLLGTLLANLALKFSGGLEVEMD